MSMSHSLINRLVIEAKNRSSNIFKRLKSIFKLFIFQVSELCISLFLFSLKK